MRSGLLMYFWIWKRFSSPFLWRLVKTARVHDFFLLLLASDASPACPPGCNPRKACAGKPWLRRKACRSSAGEWRDGGSVDPNGTGADGTANALQIGIHIQMAQSDSVKISYVTLGVGFGQSVAHLQRFSE